MCEFCVSSDELFGEEEEDICGFCFYPFEECVCDEDYFDDDVEFDSIYEVNVCDCDFCRSDFFID